MQTMWLLWIRIPHRKTEGKRIGRTTYLHSVKDVNALLVDVKKSKQFACLALSEDEKILEKQLLIHSCLGHPGRWRFNYCVENMDMVDLKLKEKDKLLHDNCEICIQAKQVKKQNHSPIPRARNPLQCCQKFLYFISRSMFRYSIKFFFSAQLTYVQ